MVLMLSKIHLRMSWKKWIQLVVYRAAVDRALTGALPKLRIAMARPFFSLWREVAEAEHKSSRATLHYNRHILRRSWDSWIQRTETRKVKSETLAKSREVLASQRARKVLETWRRRTGERHRRRIALATLAEKRQTHLLRGTFFALHQHTRRRSQKKRLKEVARKELMP